MSEDSMKIRIEKQDNVVIFLPEGNVGSLSLTEDQQVVMDRMTAAISEMEIPKIIIDMSELTFADSTFLSVMVFIWKRITEKGGQMVLAAVPDEIAQILSCTKLDQVWTSYSERQEAMTALQTS